MGQGRELVFLLEANRGPKARPHPQPRPMEEASLTTFCLVVPSWPWRTRILCLQRMRSICPTDWCPNFCRERVPPGHEGTAPPPLQPVPSPQQCLRAAGQAGPRYLIGVADQVPNVRHRRGLLVLGDKGVVAAHGGPRAVLILDVI